MEDLERSLLFNSEQNMPQTIIRGGTSFASTAMVLADGFLPGDRAHFHRDCRRYGRESGPAARADVLQRQADGDTPGKTVFSGNVERFKFVAGDIEAAGWRCQVTKIGTDMSHIRHREVWRRQM